MNDNEILVFGMDKVGRLINEILQVDKNKTTFCRKPFAAFDEYGVTNAVCIYKNTVVAISRNYKLISYTKGANPAVQVLIDNLNDF